MPDQDSRRQLRDLRRKLQETGTRIRRYTLDPRLRLSADRDSGTSGAETPANPPPRGEQSPPTARLADELRKLTDKAWEKWMALFGRAAALSDTAPQAELVEIEKAWLQLERDVDLIQRELISQESLSAGLRTVRDLAIALSGMVVAYLLTHGVYTLNFSTFEPWPEWGPLKYGEVVFWSGFGVLCYLMFLATWYLARRDFDKYYRPWYLSTGLRAPFLSLIGMMIILEFAEWYGEGGWLENYILAEGNKFYFIVFASFCLGLVSDRTASIIGDLAESVGDLLEQAVGRVSQRLRNFSAPRNEPK